MLVQEHGTDDQQLTAHFELESVLGGLASVLRAAFGVELGPAAAAADELWHPSVRKYVLASASEHGAAIGVLYLDLHPRRGKTTQPALYTLRAAADAAASGGADAAADAQLLMRHLPAAALSIDLPSTAGRTGPALLSPKQDRPREANPPAACSRVCRLNGVWMSPRCRGGG